MAKYALLPFLVSSAAACGLLLQACADVQPLSGGERDAFAPAVIPGGQTPEQGSTQFSGQQVKLKFNEFIKLNDPVNTIVMNPSVGKLTTDLHNKELIISWEEQLAENTTYILQLNGAVRDLNEGNDSIMQIVFSTGTQIDSLDLKGVVSNILTNQAAGQVSIGLYTENSDPLKERPVYATRSDAKGGFHLDYLKPGEYRIFGFIDQNRDQLPQPSETMGFLDKPVSAGDSIEIKLNVFPPVQRYDKVQAALVPPGLAIIHHLDSLDPAALRVNGEAVTMVEQFRPDSVLIALPDAIATRYSFIYGKDTLSAKTMSVKERTANFPVIQSTKTENWLPGDSLHFRINDVITSVDTNRLHLVNDKGQQVAYTSVQAERHQLVIIPTSTETANFTLHLDAGAINGRNAVSDSVTFNYKTLLAADLSNLLLHLKGFEGQWIVELTQTDKAVATIVKKAGETDVQFKALVPGQYSIRCTEDRNANGKWDTGRYPDSQPELILRYTMEQKLRPNWDVEETINRTP